MWLWGWTNTKKSLHAPCWLQSFYILLNLPKVQRHNRWNSYPEGNRPVHDHAVWTLASEALVLTQPEGSGNQSCMCTHEERFIMCLTWFPLIEEVPILDTKIIWRNRIVAFFANFLENSQWTQSYKCLHCLSIMFHKIQMRITVAAPAWPQTCQNVPL